MRHLYRISGRHGVDVVAASDLIAALARWEAQRGPSGDPEGDTAECRQIPDELVVGPGERTAGEVAQGYAELAFVADLSPAEDVVLVMGGSR